MDRLCHVVIEGKLSWLGFGRVVAEGVGKALSLTMGWY